MSGASDKWILIFFLPALIIVRALINCWADRERRRREEQAEIRRAIGSVVVFENFMEDMQNRVSEQNARQESRVKDAQRLQRIMASIVITVSISLFAYYSFGIVFFFLWRIDSHVFPLTTKKYKSRRNDDETIELGKEEATNNANEETTVDGNQPANGPVHDDTRSSGQNVFTNIFQFISSQVAPYPEHEEVVRRVEARQEGLYSSDTCAICLETYKEGDKICYAIQDCGHEFHYNCLIDWLMLNDQCPTCRSEYLIPELWK